MADDFELSSSADSDFDPADEVLSGDKAICPIYMD